MAPRRSPHRMVVGGVYGHCGGFGHRDHEAVQREAVLAFLHLDGFAFFVLKVFPNGELGFDVGPAVLRTVGVTSDNIVPTAGPPRNVVACGVPAGPGAVRARAGWATTPHRTSPLSTVMATTIFFLQSRSSAFPRLVHRSSREEERMTPACAWGRLAPKISATSAD